MKTRSMISAAIAAAVVMLAAQSPVRAQTAGEVTIGAIIPLTGAGAQYGARMRQGIELAVEQINKAGGVKGAKLNVAYADTGDQPSNGPTALRRFKQFNDIAYTLISNSNVTLATIPVAAELKVVLMNGGGQSDRLLGASPWLFSNIPATSYETRAIAEWAAKNLGKSAIVSYQTDPVGQSALAGWNKFYGEAGGKAVASESVTFEQGDYRSIVTKLRASADKANVWFIGGTYGEDAKRLITQARSLGLATPIVCTALTVATIEKDNPILRGIVHTQLVSQPKPEFVAAFKAKYGSEPEYYNAAYYNGVMIFARAWERAAEKGYGKDGDAIRRAIDEVRTYDLPGGKVEFNSQNSTVSGLEIVQVQDNGERKVLPN